MIKHTVLKTCSYALMHMIIAISVAYALSGSWQVALAIGLVEPLVQTVAFFFHERAWHRYERKKHLNDHHDSVINSTTPLTRFLDILLHRH